ncbi:MAG: hypothetical protein ABSG43_16460, partial [Solirubrobacteraceae bacterium]
WDARRALSSWLRNDGTHPQWPKASHAALTLWLHARDREVRAKVLGAERSERLIAIDGAPVPFLTLSAASGRWVAVRRHDDHTVTVAAYDLDPATITLELSPDPAARLL